MISMVFEQIKLTVKSFSVLKNQHEALVTLDFDKSERRKALMRLCFSPLASWLLILFLILFLINPFRYHLSLTQNLGLENFLSQMLLGTDWLYAVIFLILFFIINIFFRLEFLSVAVIGFLISQGDMHLLLGLWALPVVVLARLTLNLHLAFKVESFIKTVWFQTLFLSFLSCLVSTSVTTVLYKYLLQHGYYSQSMYINRYETFILSVAIYYFIELVVLSIWGHFFNLKQSDPGDLIVLYSSSAILKKLSLSRAFKEDLKAQITVLKNNQRVFAGADLDLLPKSLVDLHRKEESFLTQAISALN